MDIERAKELLTVLSDGVNSNALRICRCCDTPRR